MTTLNPRTGATGSFYDSMEWRTLRLQKLADQRCRCESCGGTNRRNNVHHKNPVRMFPQLALDYGNLIVLCNGCHESLHTVCHNRTLLGLVDIYRDPNTVTARRLDFGPFPLQFGLDFGVAANDAEFAGSG